MPTTKQRREAARRHLERQLQRREEREAAHKRFTLIASIVGTIVLIVVVTVFIVAITGEGKKGKNTAGAKSSASATSSATNSATASPSPSVAPSTQARAAKGATVTFDGVSVAGAADLGGAPGVKAKSSTVPTKLAYKDLVVGKGAAATAASKVTVQYVGALYKNGTVFDSSWARGSTATFSLTGVVPGFTQGIGGTTGVPPMKVGGRRIMILPSALGYGAQGSGSTIPPNAPLIFIVDLTGIGAA